MFLMMNHRSGALLIIVQGVQELVL